MHQRTFQRLAFCLTLGCATQTLVAKEAAKLPPPGHPLELRDGERVALIGGTFIERMQNFGYLETALTAAHPDSDITFRNLGWSGDNVWGHSRAVFNAPDAGFDRLLADLKMADPTLIIVHYGENEAHAGKEGLASFREGLSRLLDALGKATSARIVLLGPRRHENLGAPLPSQEAYNAKLDAYLATTAEVARQHGAEFFDLNLVMPVSDTAPRTSNGIHLTEAGNRELATKLVTKFAPEASLPADLFTCDHGEELRQTIIAKNELFFHRHRPQNETYLFLFRKHEQGNNAVEIPQFDPLIESKEQEIARLRKR